MRLTADQRKRLMEATWGATGGSANAGPVSSSGSASAPIAGATSSRLSDSEWPLLFALEFRYGSASGSTFGLPAGRSALRWADWVPIMEVRLTLSSLTVPTCLIPSRFHYVTLLDLYTQLF